MNFSLKLFYEFSYSRILTKFQFDYIVVSSYSRFILIILPSRRLPHEETKTNASISNFADDVRFRRAKLKFSSRSNCTNASRRV